MERIHGRYPTGSRMPRDFWVRYFNDDYSPEEALVEFYGYCRGDETSEQKLETMRKEASSVDEIVGFLLRMHIDEIPKEHGRCLMSFLRAHLSGVEVWNLSVEYGAPPHWPIMRKPGFKEFRGLSDDCPF